MRVKIYNAANDDYTLDLKYQRALTKLSFQEYKYNYDDVEERSIIVTELNSLEDLVYIRETTRQDVILEKRQNWELPQISGVDYNILIYDDYLE